MPQRREVSRLSAPSNGNRLIDAFFLVKTKVRSLRNMPTCAPGLSVFSPAIPSGTVSVHFAE
eukprot:COSAG02_NODE_3758_length_6273_cov_8.454810_6_plen_62_part_00